MRAPFVLFSQPVRPALEHHVVFPTSLSLRATWKTDGHSSGCRRIGLHRVLHSPGEYEEAKTARFEEILEKRCGLDVL